MMQPLPSNKPYANVTALEAECVVAQMFGDCHNMTGFPKQKSPNSLRGEKTVSFLQLCH